LEALRKIGFVDVTDRTMLSLSGLSNRRPSESSSMVAPANYDLDL